jgi:hypothetical protein
MLKSYSREAFDLQNHTEESRLKLNWRRGWESNPRIKVLQTLALPLGYHALVFPKASKITQSK